MIYKYSQLDPENQISYNESISICRNKNIHLGQLKLFFAELLFLAMHAKPGDTVLYVGAAPGYHTNKLIEMFPGVKFDLWDPRDFEIDAHPDVKIYQEFFTDDSAKKYMNYEGRLLFICDLRDLGIGEFKKTNDIGSMDNIASEDMILQKKWCKMINPTMVYLKFRLPYEIPKTKYLTGTIYLQPYTKISTEARLMTDDYETEILYDNILFERMLAYHNAYNRCMSTRYSKWNEIMEKYNLKNNWDNAYGLYVTRFFLKNVNNDESMREVGKLFMEIIDFHVDKYGRKYSSLFIK